MREVVLVVLLWLFLSAVIFAPIHAELGAMNVFLVLLLGLIAAWFYELRESIIPAIALHAVWNRATTLMLAGIFGA